MKSITSCMLSALCATALSMVVAGSAAESPSPSPGETTLAGEVQDTGGNTSLNTLKEATPTFKEFTLGTVTIPTTTVGKVSLKPVSIAQGSPLMQLHALILRPVASSGQE